MAIARILSTISPLCDVAAGADAEAIDEREQREDRHGDETISNGQLHQIAEIAREGDRDGGHSAGLDHEQQRPAVEEGRHRSVGVAKIGILAADLGTARGKLGVDEGGGEGDEAAKDPHADDEKRGIDVLRDFRRCDEDPGTDDAAHDEHGCVEQAEAADEAVQACRRVSGFAGHP